MAGNYERAPTPMDDLLSQAAEQTKDKLVKRWLLALRDHGEPAEAGNVAAVEQTASEPGRTRHSGAELP